MFRSSLTPFLRKSKKNDACSILRKVLANKNRQYIYIYMYKHTSMNVKHKISKHHSTIQEIWIEALSLLGEKHWTKNNKYLLLLFFLYENNPNISCTAWHVNCYYAWINLSGSRECFIRDLHFRFVNSLNVNRNFVC